MSGRRFLAGRRVLATAGVFTLVVAVWWSLPLSRAWADAGATAVLEPSVGHGAKDRHGRRVARALRQGHGAPLVARACPLQPACVAKAGAKAGAARAVGVRVQRARGQFVVTFLLVDVVSGKELRRTSYPLERKQLRTEPARLLAEFVADGPAAPAADSPAAATSLSGAAETPVQPADETSHDDADTEALSVAVGEPVVATGRAVAELVVTGSPPRRAGELARYPELPFPRCEGAATVTPLDGRPAVLVPARSTDGTVKCTVTLRGATGTAELVVRRPGPGLYAAAQKPWVLAGSGSVELSAFRVGDGSTSKPRELRVGVSGGSATVSGAGQVTLTLPDSRKPRMLVVALADPAGPGAAFLPVWGQTELEVRASTRSKVSVRIAGQWFGPVVARRRKATVPVTVPPGATRAVVRGAERDGFALESVADLNTPALPRIAAVMPAEQLSAGVRSFVAVAVASGDGRPAANEAPVRASGSRGQLGQPVALGGGLWRVPYTAPDSAGADEIVVAVDGDESAGTARISVQVVAGTPAAVRFELPAEPVGPGEQLRATVYLVDDHGNRMPWSEGTVTLGTEPVAGERSGAALVITAVVPTELPSELRLRARVGAIAGEQLVPTRAGPPVTATISSEPAGGGASVSVAPRDQHGNLAELDSFDVGIEHGEASDLVRTGDHYRFRVRGTGGASSAEVIVTAGMEPLAAARVRFEPSPGAIMVGVYATGGWLATGGMAQSPRAGGGILLSRRGRRLDLALLVGALGHSSTSRATVEVQGMPRAVERAVSALELPFLLRGRWRLGRRLGIFAGVGLVSTRVTVTVEPEFQQSATYTDSVVGGRAELGLDLRLGPGRISAGARYGTAELTDGMVVGTIDGLSGFVGYEWAVVVLGD